MLSIVVPAYNEEVRLSKTLSEIQNHAAGRIYEIIVVDDGSSDRTAEIAEKFGCLMIRHPVNMGKGAAVKTGVMTSRGETVLITDADMAAPISELPKLEAALEKGLDVVMGSRVAPGAKVVRATFKRKLAGKVFNLLVRLLTGLPYRDTQCGFKLFRGDAARELFSRAACEGYCFDVEILLIAREMGMKVKEVGVNWTDIPGSKVQLFKDGLKTFRELLKAMKFAGSCSPATTGTSAPESAPSSAS